MKTFQFATLMSAISLFFLGGCVTTTNLTQIGTPPPPLGPVLTISQSGGCARGNACATIRILEDGSFEVAPASNRINFATGDTFSGRLPADLMADWLAEATRTDWPEFIAKLGPGAYRAPSDGIDKIYTVNTDGVPVSLNSTEVGFDWRLRFFELSNQIEGEAIKGYLAERYNR